LIPPSSQKQYRDRSRVQEITIDEAKHYGVFFLHLKSFSPKKAWSVAVWDTTISKQGMSQ
jgi:hypothetical protein